MTELSKCSLDPYIRVNTASGQSFGGSQMWFPKDRGFTEKKLNVGGCGLVAAVDFMLWYCLKNHKVPKNFPEGVLNGDDFLIEKDEYMDFLRYVSTHGYPILPKFGSFSFELSAYLNRFLASVGNRDRIRFLWQNDPKKRLELAEESIRRGYPCILIIGPHVLSSPGKHGVNFYRRSADGKLHLAYRNVYAHFVMLTGVLKLDDVKKPVLFEISSWGQKLYLSSEEYTEYIRRCSSPVVCGMFTLQEKKRR